MDGMYKDALKELTRTQDSLYKVLNLINPYNVLIMGEIADMDQSIDNLRILIQDCAEFMQIKEQCI